MALDGEAPASMPGAEATSAAQSRSHQRPSHVARGRCARTAHAPAPAAAAAQRIRISRRECGCGSIERRTQCGFERSGGWDFRRPREFYGASGADEDSGARLRFSARKRCSGDDRGSGARRRSCVAVAHGEGAAGSFAKRGQCGCIVWDGVPGTFTGRPAAGLRHRNASVAKWRTGRVAMERSRAEQPPLFGGRCGCSGTEHGALEVAIGCGDGECGSATAPSTSTSESPPCHRAQAWLAHQGPLRHARGLTQRRSWRSRARRSRARCGEGFSRHGTRGATLFVARDIVSCDVAWQSAREYRGEFVRRHWQGQPAAQLFGIHGVGFAVGWGRRGCAVPR
mmetsp:Transcript_24954/g.71653  ORF Transcript_24954/g.71653 Transcript_24954/m.71653 type:complete len:339 (+) Transcript_24954:1304-2320(+)